MIQEVTNGVNPSIWSSKNKFGICAGTMKVPGAKCGFCQKFSHKKCMGLSSRSLQEERISTNTWSCTECDHQREMAKRKDNKPIEIEQMIGRTIKDGVRKQKLVIIQWNSDHLMAKVPELEKLMKEKNVDIAIIQETKLREEDKFTGVRGYAAVRKDRNREGMSRWSRGGGVMILIRTDLPYDNLPTQDFVDKDDITTEMVAARVMLNEKEAVNVLNVYCPPHNSEGINEDTIERTIKKLPKDECWLIEGDWNAHHHLWDNMVPKDRRGKGLNKWIKENRGFVLNDGSVTRQERGTQRRSTPDITLCHESWVSRMEWRTLQRLSSDHLVIEIGINAEVVTEPPRKVLAWTWRKARSEDYKETVDKLL